METAVLGRYVKGISPVAFFGLLSAAGPAAAEFNPDLRGHLETEFFIGSSFQADSEELEQKSVFIEVETAQFDFRPIPQFGAVLNIGFEPAVEELEGETTIFKRMAPIAEELYLHYETVTLFPDYIDSARVFAGKFSPNFGLEFGFDQQETEMPGAFTDNFMEEYELKEKIGVGGNITPYHRKYGFHRIAFSAFFDDTTFLSRDAFKARNPRRKTLSQGGAGNTQSLESYNLTVKGSDMSFVPGFNYEVGLRHLEKGKAETDVKDENGFAVGAQYKKAFFLPRDRFRYPITMLGSVEYAHFSGFGGADVLARFITAGLGAFYGPWNFGVAYSRKSVSSFLPEADDDGEEDVMPRRDNVDDRWQVSSGRRLTPFLILHVLWAYEEENGQGKNILGAIFEFEQFF